MAGVGVNAFRGYLAQSLAEAGSETTVYLTSIETLTGENMATADFSVFGKGLLCVDPLNSTNIEFISFTGVDSTNVALTGATRGLSAFDYTSSTSRMNYHPVSTQVIITFGTQSLTDLKTYIDNAVSGSLGTASDTSAGSMKVDRTMGSLPRARGTTVSQQASPNMTLLVRAFNWVGVNKTINYAGGNTSAMVAPVSNPRIDLVVYDTNASAIAVRTGTEAASPSRPTPTSGDVLLCSVYHRVGETTLLERDTSPNTQGYIQEWYEPTLYDTNTYQTVAGTHDATTDQTQGTSNGTITVGEANATTKHSLIAQKFVAAKSSIKGVRMWKIADTGSFTGTVTISLQADSSGSPSGSNLASFAISNAAWLKLTGAAEFEVTFTSEYTLVPGTSYWIVVTCSTGDNSNHPNFGINTAGGYASGALKYNNSADGWVLVATSMAYFKTLVGVQSKLVETDATEGYPLSEVRPYGLIDMDATSVDVTGDTTETTVYSKQLKGGLLTTNGGLRIKGFFTHSLNGGTGPQTETIKVKYNGSNLLSIVSQAIESSNGYDGGYNVLELLVVNQNATNSQKVYAILNGFPTSRVGTPTADNAVTSLSPVTSLSTSAIDLSQPGLLTVTITASTTGGGNAKVGYRGLTVEKVASLI